MSVRLSRLDECVLAGDLGDGARMAMAIMVRMAEVYEAEELMDVTQAHIDGCGLLSDAGVEFAETLLEKGAKVGIPTTLNMGPLDLQQWRQFDVSEDFAAKAVRQAKAYEGMGCIPTWTCAPYQGYLTPRFGQQIAWGESNAVAYANSVLGARTNRYGDYLDICAAITGRVPKAGLHLTENRRAQVLYRLRGFSEDAFRDESFYPSLGHLVGARCGESVPAVDGVLGVPSDDHLKALGAAIASAGSVALYHLIGITPEAPTVEAACRGREPEQTHDLLPADLLKARREFSSCIDGDKLDCVILGCPHYSYAEFHRLAEIISQQPGNRVNADVTFIVATGEQSYSLLHRQPYLLKSIEAFGARITLDTCAFHTPIVRLGTRVVMTDSGKCAYYAPGELGVKVAFGTMADCVRSAIEGRIRREEVSWNAK